MPKPLLWRPILVALLAAVSLAQPVHAQKTKAQINTEITSTFVDNNIGAITPAKLRTVSSDIVNSIMPTAPVAPGNLACFDGATGLLKDCGVAPPLSSVVGISDTQTLTNKTINGANNSLTVRLANDVSGNLPVGNLNSGTGASASTYWRGDGQWATPAGSVSASPIANSLGGNVTMNSINTYFSGPVVAQGSTGTWFASGTITYTNSSADEVQCKLWDGTTVFASAAAAAPIATNRVAVALSGMLSSPAGNIRIDCKSVSTNTGLMEFNRSGNSKDSTVSAFRIQ